MTPYGYHNSEINHRSGAERKNAREAMRQAKLVREGAIDEVTGGEPGNHAARPRRLHRLLHAMPRLAPRAYLRHLRAHAR